MGFDQRGHGRSEGPTVYIPNFEEVLADSYKFVSTIRAEYPDVPLFAAGTSMGGLISLSLARRYPDLFGALLLSAPYLDSP